MTRIRTERKLKGLSVSELARLLEIPEQSLYRWETGRCQRTCYKKTLEDFFNLPITELFQTVEGGTNG